MTVLDSWRVGRVNEAFACLAKNSSQHESRRFANVSVGPKTLGPQALTDAVRQPTWGMTEGRQEVWGLKPTDFRELNHPSQFRSLDGSRLGRIADERQVTARPVVVRKVPTKDTT